MFLNDLLVASCHLRELIISFIFKFWIVYSLSIVAVTNYYILSGLLCCVMVLEAVSQKWALWS